jgi:hypothetical protein
MTGPINPASSKGALWGQGAASPKLGARDPRLRTTQAALLSDDVAGTYLRLDSNGRLTLDLAALQAALAVPFAPAPPPAPAPDPAPSPSPPVPAPVSGDNVLVNGSDVTGADLNDAEPSSPPDALNARWQWLGSDPARVSAYLPFATRTQAGVVSASAQEIGGAKTLQDPLALEQYVDFSEIDTPDEPGTDVARLYAFDFHGQTRLGVLFPDGSELVLTRDNIIVARNTSGSSMTAGQAVRITGSTGNVPNVALAQADDILTMPAVGIVYERITHNQFGRVMFAGRLGMDTTGFLDGKPLYVSPSTPGDLTSTAPVAPDLLQQVGYVLVGGVGNGEILVAPFVTLSGSGGGDSVLVNGVDVDDADFNDVSPAAPAGALNVVWQETGSAPTEVSAHVVATEVLDILGTEHGAVLYRDSAAWGVLAPGTDGQVLTTHDTGADPTWETPGASAGGDGYPAQLGFMHW